MLLLRESWPPGQGASKPTISESGGEGEGDRGRVSSHTAEAETKDKGKGKGEEADEDKAASIEGAQRRLTLYSIQCSRLYITNNSTMSLTVVRPSNKQQATGDRPKQAPD